MNTYDCSYCGEPVKAGKTKKQEDVNAENHLKKCTGIDRKAYNKNRTVTRKR